MLRDILYCPASSEHYVRMTDGTMRVLGGGGNAPPRFNAECHNMPRPAVNVERGGGPYLPICLYYSRQRRAHSDMHLYVLLPAKVNAPMPASISAKARPQRERCSRQSDIKRPR